MTVKQGNITGSISTVAFDIPCKIISGFFTNRTSGSVNVSVYIATPEGDRAVVDTTIISGSVHVIDAPIVLLAGYYLIVVSNASLDYYFSIE